MAFHNSYKFLPKLETSGTVLDMLIIVEKRQHCVIESLTDLGLNRHSATYLLGHLVFHLWTSIFTLTK